MSLLANLQGLHALHTAGALTAEEFRLATNVVPLAEEKAAVLMLKTANRRLRMLQLVSKRRAKLSALLDGKKALAVEKAAKDASASQLRLAIRKVELAERLGLSVTALQDAQVEVPLVAPSADSRRELCQDSESHEKPLHHRTKDEG